MNVMFNLIYLSTQTEQTVTIINLEMWTKIDKRDIWEGRLCFDSKRRPRLFVLLRH